MKSSPLMKTSAPKMTQCDCGQWFTGSAKSCPRCRNLGKRKHPLYNTWSVHYNKHWPTFIEFLAEVGNPPTPGHWLTGKIEGTRPSPGNVRWVPGKRLEKVTLTHLENTTPMIFDDEFKKLAIEAYIEKQENPASEIIHLNNIEEKSRKAYEEAEDLEALQRSLEEESQAYNAALKKEAEARLASKGRSSQVRVGRRIRQKLVPILAMQLKKTHDQALAQRSGRHHAVVAPLMEALEYDWDLVAHITVTMVLDGIGRGVAMSTPLTRVLTQIGQRLDHEAFLRRAKNEDPTGWERVDRWALQKVAKGYHYKIKTAKGLTALGDTYEFLDDTDQVKVGDWCFNGLWANTKWFEKVPWVTRSSGKSRIQYFLGLSEEGIERRDAIQAAADEACFEPWPMVVKPLRWNLEEAERGGYLLPHKGQISRLIHNNRETIPSEDALKALHKAQEVPFRINPFIFEIQKSLLGKSEEIGSFRTYEKDSWEDLNKPKIDPRVWDLPSENEERMAAKGLLRAYYNNQKVAEKTRKSPLRVLRVAARFRHVDRFYLPCYFDNRLRLYYAVDTITPNGADWQKALLIAADGGEVTDENRAEVERQLFITLANTWANKENGVKTDKLNLDGRVAFARDFVKELEVVARDPLSTAARAIWTAASEPFQFLACVREIFEVLIWCTKTHTHLLNGRDATNSGTQILGALCLDEAAMFYTNVVPTEEPQDLYGVVAVEAVALLTSEPWVSDKIAHYTKQTKAKMRKREKEGKLVHPVDYSAFALGIDPNDVDRSILKRAIMCTNYNASWQSKNSYISDELNEAYKGKEYDPTLTDKRLVTDSSIEGLASAFPVTDRLNKWFKLVGRSAMKEGKELLTWKTPGGSTIVQEYREPITKRVTTHAMGSDRYQRVSEEEDAQGRIQLKVQTGWGPVLENKAGSALGANFTHSLDADVIHGGINGAEGEFFTVHDCGYFLATNVEQCCQALRDSFHRVVTGNPMQSLLEENGLALELPVQGNGDLSRCKESTYMFS